MSSLTLNDWKKFLSARLEQESGNDTEALAVFELLLDKYPYDPHLTASKAIALNRLGREEEAAAAIISSSYSVMAKTLVGNEDKPESWENALSGAIDEIEHFETKGSLSSALVAW